MYFLWSIPPQTLGIIKPACLATSTNCTPGAAASCSTVSTKSGLRHFHSGVAKASSTELLITRRDAPRKRRRGRTIGFDNYTEGGFSREQANEVASTVTACAQDLRKAIV